MTEALQIDKDRVYVILNLEDSEIDAELIKRQLQKEGLHFQQIVVADRESFSKSLEHDSPDLVISDYHLPQYDGLSALEYVRGAYPELPFILVSGQIGEELAIEGMRRGASDYVLKSNLTRLGSAVTRALSAASERAGRLSAESYLSEQAKLMRDVLESLGHPFIVIDAETYEVKLANPAALAGRPLLPGTTCHELLHGLSEPCSGELACVVQRIKQTGMPVSVEHPHVDAKGERGIYDVHGYPILGPDGRVTGIIEYNIDVTERRLMEGAIHTALDIVRQSGEMTSAEVIAMGLEEAVRITDSTIGYFHMVDEDAATITLKAWSSGTAAVCDVATGAGHEYAMESAGIWIDCIRERVPVIHNDYPANPDKKGLPEGHVPMIRDLALPIISGQGIVSVIGVGNKVSDYGDSDIARLSLIAETVASIVERKDAALALMESERSKATLVSNLSGIAYRALPSADRPMEFVSDGASAILGYEAPLLLSGGDAPLDSLIDPEDIAMVRSTMSRSIADGATYAIEYRVREAGGDLRWLRDQGRAVLDPLGGSSGASVIAIEGLITDITKSKELEEQLRMREEQVRHAYTDVFHAVTQGKLILRTRSDIGMLLGGEELFGFDIPDSGALSGARARLTEEFAKRLVCVQSPGDVTLAFGEAITNGVKHAGSCHVNVHTIDDENGCSHLRIVISDHGPGIDFTELPKAALMAGYSTKRSLGLGFTVMLELCSNLYMATDEQGTILALEFACAPNQVTMTAGGRATVRSEKLGADLGVNL